MKRNILFFVLVVCTTSSLSVYASTFTVTNCRKNIDCSGSSANKVFLCKGNNCSFDQNLTEITFDTTEPKFAFRVKLLDPNSKPVNYEIIPIFTNGFACGDINYFLKVDSTASLSFDKNLNLEKESSFWERPTWLTPLSNCFTITKNSN